MVDPPQSDTDLSSCLDALVELALQRLEFARASTYLVFISRAW